MYYVYILKSEIDFTFYTGVTEYFNKRLKEHNEAKIGYTKSKRPLKLIWYCWFNDKNKAYKFEKNLKTGSGISFRNKHLI